MQSIQPVNFIEDKIKLLLCTNGYQQRDIEFKKFRWNGVALIEIE